MKVFLSDTSPQLMGCISIHNFLLQEKMNQLLKELAQSKLCQTLENNGKLSWFAEGRAWELSVPYKSDQMNQHKSHILV